MRRKCRLNYQKKQNRLKFQDEKKLKQQFKATAKETLAFETVKESKLSTDSIFTDQEPPASFELKLVRCNFEDISQLSHIDEKVQDSHRCFANDEKPFDSR